LGDLGGVWVEVLHQEGKGNRDGEVKWRVALEGETDGSFPNKRNGDVHGVVEMMAAEGGGDGWSVVEGAPRFG
jgi:hypothetical protein